MAENYAELTAARVLLAGVPAALGGGGACFRSVGPERLLRDVHGARLHPLQEKRQHLLSGRLALGLDPVG